MSPSPEPHSLATPLAYALAYAALGYYVLPLIPRDKSPLGRLVPGGHKNATTDEATIRRWWGACPDAGIGIAMQASGLVTIDIDPRNGGLDTMEQLEARHGPMVSDVLAYTGGGGEHRVFLSAMAASLPGKLGPGVDVKADGYIVVEPSIHPSGKQYVWEASSDPLHGAVPSTLPGWVRDLSRTLQVADVLPAVRWVDPKQVDELRQALQVLPADDYHQWVAFGNALSELGQAGFTLWDEWSQRSSKYNPAAMTRKWRSFKPGAVRIESIFFEAQQAGWVNPMSLAASVQLPLPVESAVSLGESDPAPLPQESVPSELMALPGQMGACMAWMIRTANRPQPVLAMAATLSLFAAAMSTKICSPTRLRTNLYLVSVAGTSSGKDHGRKCLAAVLQAAKLDHLIGGDEIASGQGLLARAHKCPRTVFQIDEFGLMLQSIRSRNAGPHLAGIIKNLMMLFGSTDSIYRGTEYADQKLRERKDIEYPCVNLHATTTPEQFFPALGSHDVTSGALNRMLIFMAPEGIVPRQDIEPEAPPEAVVAWIEAAQRLQLGMQGLLPASPIPIPFDSDASSMFSEFGTWIDTYSEKANDSNVAALWGRAWENAVKLALLHAMSSISAMDMQTSIDAGTLQVRAASAAWGISLARHVITAMEHELAARVGDSEFDILTKDVIRVIRKAGRWGLTVRELGRKCAAYKSREPRVQDAVHVAMSRQEECVQVKFPPPSGRGQHRLAWVAAEFVIGVNCGDGDESPVDGDDQPIASMASN